MLGKRYTIASLCFLAVGGMVAADEVKGTITGVNPDTKELVIEVRTKAARGLSMSFNLAADAKVSLSHEAASISDLKTGEKVRVLYEIRDGKRIALAVSAHGLKSGTRTGGTTGTAPSLQ